MLHKFTLSLLASLVSIALHAETTDQIIIKFRAAPASGMKRVMSVEDVNRFAAFAGEGLALKRAMSGDAYVLKLDQAVTNEEARLIAQRIAQSDADIEFAEPDAKRFIRFEPLDPEYPNQWTLDDAASPFAGAGDIRAEAAWDISRGSSSVVVAVLDTGHLPHRDINEARILPGYDFISNLAVAGDGDGRDADPTDPGDFVVLNECEAGSVAESSSWHGLLVEGIASAATNNNIDVAGIDHFASILPVRVLGKCGGFTSDIADAMRWSVGIPVAGVPNNAHKAKVINLSLGSTAACSTTEQSAINDAVAQGAVVVVSAGNESTDVSNSAPANCNNVVAVAAIDRAGDLAGSYTNFGDLVDISAPGGEPPDVNAIRILQNAGATTATTDSVALAIGTSLASAHVAGVVSLMFAVNPALTPAQIESTLKSTARAFSAGSTCNSSLCGDGIVNASAALSSASSQITTTAATSSGGGGGGGSVGWISLFVLLLGGWRNKKAC